MRKINLVLLLSIGLTSCLKDSLDPVTDKNSALKLENIKFDGLSGGNAFSGTLSYQFLVESDTSASLDTFAYTSNFEVENPLNFSQIFDFNTPARTKSMNFSLFFRIKNGGTATSVSISPVSFKKDGVSYFHSSTNIPGELLRDSLFYSPPQTINFD